MVPLGPEIIELRRPAAQELVAAEDDQGSPELPIRIIGQLIEPFEFAWQEAVFAQKPPHGRDSLGRVQFFRLWAVVIARINPLLSNDAISFIAGMLGMNFWKFLLATLAGITPLTVAIAVFGEDWQSMKTGLLWLSAASLIGLGVKIWFDKKMARQA